MTKEEQKFNELYEDFETLPFIVLQRLNVPTQDRKDISQEAWCRVWRNINRIDYSLSFGSYLFTVTKNLAFDLYRKYKIEKSKTSSLNYDISDDSELSDVLKVEDLPEDDLDSTDQFDVLIREIDILLSGKNKIFLKALINSGLSYIDLFKTLDCDAMGTMKSNITRGRTFLKKRSSVYRELKGL